MSKEPLSPIPENERLSWLYVDMNSYFASVEQQEHPELRGKPVGVVPLLADTTCFIAASYEAKAFGVKTGVRVGDGKKMCPGLKLVEANHETYIRYHHKIIAAVESCLPIDSVCSIDEMACQLTGSQQSLERATQIAAQIKKAIATQVGEAVRCSIGVAPNRYLAKIAGDMMKPDGFTVIRKCDLPQKLFSLKLRDLPGIGARMEERLNQHQIYTVKELCAFNSPQLHKAFGGILGEKMWKYLQGLDVEEEETGPQKSISHSHVLPPELRNDAGALQTLKKLVAKAAVRLRKQRAYASSLSLSIRYAGDKESWVETTRMIETQDTPTLVRTLSQVWEHRPPGSIFAVGVALGALVSELCHMPSLFENPRQAKLSHVMDDLNQKFGKELIQYGATHQSENIAPLRIAFTNIPEIPYEDDEE